MAKYFIGMDLGTSSTRAYLIDFDTMDSYVAGEGYDVLYPRPGHAEHDPETWYRAACTVLKKVLSESNVDPDDIIAVSFSGQMHGCITLGEDGKPVMNAPLWLDQRSGDAVAEIYEKIGRKQFLANTQNGLGTGFLLSSLYWFKLNRPEEFKKITRVLLPKDYLKYRLCGKAVTDYSDAAGSLVFNNIEMQWAWNIIDTLGLPREVFPEVLPSTAVIDHITEEAARDTGLSTKTLVVNGGSDCLMACIGNGVVNEGIITSNIGTSSLICTPASKPVYDELSRCNTYAHVLPERWNIMGACLNGGSTLKWLTQKILLERDYNVINALAEASPVGAKGLVFLPYLAGERTPHMDPKARGTYFGYTLEHDRGDMIRALMEGVAFGLKDGLNLLLEMGCRCDRIIAAGGGARSDVWLQIQADIFEKDVYRSASKEQACLGAAMTAAVGAGTYADFNDACEHCVAPVTDVFHPIAENVKVYRELYPIFRQLYQSNKQNFAALTDLFNS